MKVRIIKVIPNIPKPIALCKTDYGNISVCWMENIPILYEIYDVVFEINEILFWDKDIIPSKEPLAMYDDDFGIKLIGDLEEIDEDGYLVLRIGDSIITCVTKNVPKKIGLRIEVRVKCVDAYPIEY